MPKKKFIPVRKRAIARYEDIYAKPWAGRIASSPQLEAMIKELCTIEEELSDILDRIDGMEARGEETRMIVCKNGEVTEHPLRKQLKDLRSAQRGFVKQLGMSYDRKDPERTKKSAIASRLSDED